MVPWALSYSVFIGHAFSQEILLPDAMGHEWMHEWMVAGFREEAKVKGRGNGYRLSWCMSGLQEREKNQKEWGPVMCAGRHGAWAGRMSKKGGRRSGMR